MGYPSLIHVEVTNRCNLNCKMCGRTLMSLKGKSDLSFDLYVKIIDQASRMGTEMIILHSWGEPLLHPDIDKMIFYASQRGLPTWLSTNATLLDDCIGLKLIQAGLGGIVFSVDGATAKTYEEIRRGASFEKVSRNIENFLKLKKDMRSRIMCTVQMIEMQENRHEMDDFKAKWAQHDVNVLVKPLVDWSDDATQKRSTSFICDKLWYWMKIQSDGKVYPCGHDFDKRHYLGDIYRESLSDIWRGERYIAFRKNMINGWQAIDICRQCGYSPPRKRDIINNIGFCFFDNFTLTKLIFQFGYKK